jgi:hypothetical protein
MGWLDANEYFLMERVAWDRVNDPRFTVGLALASADDAAERPRPIPESGARKTALDGAILVPKVTKEIGVKKKRVSELRRYLLPYGQSGLIEHRNR